MTQSAKRYEKFVLATAKKHVKLSKTPSETAWGVSHQVQGESKEAKYNCIFSYPGTASRAPSCPATASFSPLAWARSWNGSFLTKTMP